MALSTIERERQWNLPNLLTYGRMVAVPAVAGCLFAPDDFRMRWLALAIFTVAGITDFFDGYLARAWNQQSSLGRMLDPIADKLLVAASLLMLVADGSVTSWSIWAAIVILCREILVSGLREFLAELRVSVPVTKVAKVEDHGAARRRRLPHRGAGRRARAARHAEHRPRAAVDRRGPDALHGLGLHEGRLQADGGVTT